MWSIDSHYFRVLISYFQFQGLNILLPTRCAIDMMIFGAGLLSSMSHIRGELGDMSTASIAAGVVADSA